MRSESREPRHAGTLQSVGNGLGLTVRVGRALLPYARGDTRSFAVAALWSLLFLAFRLAQPWPVKWVVDGLTGHATPWGADLVVLCVAYVIFSAGAGLSEYGQRRAVAGLANRIVYRFRGFLFTRVLGLPLAYQERRGSGELLTRVVWDTARLRRGVGGILLRMYQATLIFAATVGVLAWVSPLLAGVLLVFGLVAMAAMLGSNRKILNAARVSRKREGRLASVVEEDLRGARDLQTYRQTGDRRFDEQNDRSLRGEQKLVRLESGLLLKVEILMAVAVSMILWLGTRGVEAGSLTAGDLVLFVHYTLALYRPFTQFARQAAQAGRTGACAERLLRITERHPAATGGTFVAPPLAGEIVFEDVRVKASQRARGGRFWLLDGVSFRIKPGERTAVMGPNGAGKSTLLKQLLRLQERESGRILVDGRDVREYTLDSFRNQFSVVHEGPALFGLTVRENVAFGRTGASDAEIVDALERAGAGEFLLRLPRRLDTVVRGARIFSTGERQRLALARAILRGGRVWLLDEPTTALDQPQELERTLLEEGRGKTLLWITHDLATAMRMDRILVLTDGKVRFAGSPAELQASLSGRGAGGLLVGDLAD